jgi:cytochrome c oxidase assembly protein Cox11
MYILAFLITYKIVPIYNLVLQVLMHVGGLERKKDVNDINM